MAVGWIKSYRKMTEHWIWKTREPFDRRSAWQSILFEAYYKDEKVMHKGELVFVKRGQFPTSIRDLADKWMWSIGKVQRFLDALEAEHMVERSRLKNGTLLTIVNYGIYQDERYTDDTPTGIQTDTPTIHSRNTDGYTHDTLTEHNIRSKENKEYKEDKKERREEDILTVSNETVCQTDVRRIIDRWNALSEFGIKPIKKIGNGTKVFERLCARIREYGIDDVLSTVDMIKDSDFLLGKVKDFTITLDWFSRPNNFQKVYNGNYSNGNRKNGYQSQTAQMLDSFYDQTAEWVRKMEQEEQENDC